VSPQGPLLRGDALRYIEYGLNLHQHGVFGLADGGTLVPGDANAPLYPALIALGMKLDPALAEGLACVVIAQSGAGCGQNYGGFLAAQNGLLVLALVAIWLAVKTLLRSSSIAWLSVVWVFLSGDPREYASRFLTEALVFPLLCLFLLLLSLTVVSERRGRGMAGWTATGIVVGLLALTRPEYVYLFYALAIALAFNMFRSRPGRAVLSTFGMLACFSVSFTTIISPWLLRNHEQFDRLSITSSYGDVTLAQRAAYNEMGVSQWLTSYLYWFPDVGDEVAERYLAPQRYEKLGFGPDSYYQAGSQRIVRSALRVVDSREAALGHILRTEVLNRPFKHAIVTLPLLWRGLFIAKYWGVLGLVSLIYGLCWAYRHQPRLILLCLPALAMASLYALVSVSIPRYNLMLIPCYSVAMAAISDFLLRRLWQRFAV